MDTVAKPTVIGAVLGRTGMHPKWSPETRRGFPRLHASFPVALHQEGDDQLIHGVTLNLSRGGALLRIDAPVQIGHRYLVQFTDERNTLVETIVVCDHCGHASPPFVVPRQTVWAVAKRQGRGAHGFSAAFEFETLIEVIDHAGT